VPDHGTSLPAVQRLRDPHLVLGAGVAATIALEAAYRTWISDVWLLLQAGVAGAAFLLAWRVQERLRLLPVLGLALALLLGLVAVHLALDVTGDKDSSVVYRWQGNGLNRGDYPRSEYPIGAVLLFGLEAWLGGGSTKTPNALLMAPFQLLTIGCIWLTRMRYAPWLAAVVGLWPLNAFYWEFKFDLVPAGLLVLGLLLAYRERWALSGVALGAGALVKWTPALTVVALVVWLLASRRTRNAIVHAGAAVATVAIVYVPFLVWSPDEVLAAYSRQSGRDITPESVWYLLLRPLDLARVRTHISFSAGAPDWANVAATVLQVAMVVLVLAAAVRVRGNLRAGVAVAAAAPVVFLLTNRIFSPQFVLVVAAALAFAAALVVRTREEQLAVGVALCAASLANAFVYPFALPRYAVTWPLCSAVLFVVGLGLTAWTLLRATSASAPTPAAAASARATT
jgi:hypothetical protein